MHDIRKCISWRVVRLIPCIFSWCMYVGCGVLGTVIGLALGGCPAAPAPSGLIAPNPAPLSQTQPVTAEVREAFRAAQAVRTTENLSQAIQAFAEFAQRYPNTALTDDALMMVGDLTTAQKAYEKAEIYYRLLLRSFPQSEHSSAARFKLGLVLYRLHDYADSAATLQRYIETVPVGAEQGVAYYYVGMVAMRKQQYAEALADFKKALELSKDPEISSEARANLVAIVREHLTTADLTRLAQVYTDVYPGDILLARLAQTYQEAKQLDKEIATLQQLLAAFPTYADAPAVQARLQYLTILLETDWTKLGVLLPLSGDDGPIGQHALRGMELAVETFKRRHPDLPLTLEVRDTGDTAATAQAALRALVQEARVIGVIGPLSNQTAFDLAPLADELTVPLLSPYARYGNFPALSVYTFRYTLTEKAQARALADYAVHGLQRQRFAIMYPAELYGETLKEQFLQQILSQQAEVVATIAYPSTTTDFTAYLQALREVQFDTVFLPDYIPRLALLLEQLSTQGFTNVQLLGADGWHTPALLTQLLVPILEGSVFTDGFFAATPAPDVQEFVGQFYARYQEGPTTLAAHSYDAVLLCAEVLKTGVKTRLQLRDGLLQVGNFQGITGLATIDPDGDAVTIPTLLTIRQGKALQLQATPTAAPSH